MLKLMKIALAADEKYNNNEPREGEDGEGA